MVKDIDGYVDEVLRFSSALNLTSIKNRKDFVSRFIEPSLALQAWLPTTGLLLDVGSGSGIPAIPLLLANHNLTGVLVERRKKRAEFLRHIKRCLDIDMRVYAEDVVDIAPLGVDACVARAVSSPTALLNMVAAHVRKGGKAVLPTSLEQDPVMVDGWQLKGEHDWHHHIRQKVLVYVREDVSRET